MKAAFDKSGLVFLENRYIKEYLRDQHELMHLLLGDKKLFSRHEHHKLKVVIYTYSLL